MLRLMPWHRGIEPHRGDVEAVEDQRRAGVEGIESEAMLCCVEDRALASSPIEPGVEPYRAIHVLHTASVAPSSRVNTMLQRCSSPTLVNKV